MKTIRVRLKKSAYNIIVGAKIINRLAEFISRLGIGGDAYVITNAAIKNKYSRVLVKALKQSHFALRFKVVPATEKSKSIEMVSAVVKDITRYDRKKRIFIIAFGGGVIGDLAGFIASIYKRGIPYIQVPTTLLAQVDSSIGGKTAVDLIQGKNLLGTFYQPRLVLSDVNVLKTLDLRQVRSGLAEVIKYGIIKDRQLFAYLEKRYKDILAFKTGSLEFIVKRCSEIKAGIIRQDEREEKGIRTILNFGHTIGHAIEAAGGYKRYNHGEAIALGMLAASEISHKLGLIDKGTIKRIENLIRIVGLPTKIRGISIERIIKAHYRDKKFMGYKNRFVLIKGIGKTRIVENIPLVIIREALKGKFNHRIAKL
ncbi:MAG: 3-dehydroquinate synthase [Candidatus Omnitrophica bacterium]|nr:3-dehydroquinate synthase [Candidatus Omnitrophota bacterium]MBU4345793.1 3-dehydroquinate synthase [Candidatus Omnitrophota bacterium]MBU4473448.1 3-dehydroquinate synthase [Candidatus Omnitrophota bacterium]MCG2706217.1 3-dehydroquinate synthase [Candidatus Omnitrophota bacterium]